MQYNREAQAFAAGTLCPSGLDATIRYGKKDLRMKNIMPFPLYIFTSINDKGLAVVIKADRGTETGYEIYTEEEEVNLPFVNDETGMTKRAYLSMFTEKSTRNGKTESLLLYKDFYPPMQLDR